MTDCAGEQNTGGERAREETVLRVGLIDANTNRAHRLRRTLEQIDATVEVDTFTDGAAALADLTTRAVAPALILLALDLPGRRSWEVLTALAAHARLRLIPVVVLPAGGRDTDRARAYAMGASGEISAATPLRDLQVTLARTRLYWQVMACSRQRPAGVG